MTELISNGYASKDVSTILLLGAINVVQNRKAARHYCCRHPSPPTPSTHTPVSPLLTPFLCPPPPNTNTCHTSLAHTHPLLHTRTHNIDAQAGCTRPSTCLPRMMVSTPRWCAQGRSSSMTSRWPSATALGSGATTPASSSRKWTEQQVWAAAAAAAATGLLCGCCSCCAGCRCQRQSCVGGCVLIAHLSV